MTASDGETRVDALPGLGPKSGEWLAEIGIRTRDDLQRVGPARAWLRLADHRGKPPSLNLLYAMVGALENRRWIDIARADKGVLLLELEGYRELAARLKDEGIDFRW